MKAFLCHSSNDSEFVIKVAKHLKRNLEGIFYFEDYQRADVSFVATINEELGLCDVMVVFVGKRFSEWQTSEANEAIRQYQAERRKQFGTVLLPGNNGIPPTTTLLNQFPIETVEVCDEAEAFRVAKAIIMRLGRRWVSVDDLPYDPHLFSYEKDIIDFFIKASYRKRLAEQPDADIDKIRELESELRVKWLDGCPIEWPGVVRWGDDEVRSPNPLDPNDVGKLRPPGARVVVAALTDYHGGSSENEAFSQMCLVKEGLCFPEAGPREHLYFPRPLESLRVAVLVSGGIAPGINAVIDGIVQRHYQYAMAQNHALLVNGIRNGFQAFNLPTLPATLLATYKFPGYTDVAPMTSEHANTGGAFLGTSRSEELLDLGRRGEMLHMIAHQLLQSNTDILYVIGGDGSMKAAHAIWSTAREIAPESGFSRKLSVIAIPKTMDNDILWMWQSFGFLSAVERAKEIVAVLSTEVESNPRLCVVQLYGSDSGFVVSHAVLASRRGHCDAALIPEVPFSLRALAVWIKTRMCVRMRDRGDTIPGELIVMAETAIPTDAMDFIDDPDVGLDKDEQAALRDFETLRRSGKRIQGQTNELLRNAGLRLVSRGLKKLIPDPRIRVESPVEPQWSKLRVFTNEPRHLLRAIAPSVSDIITGQRLGTLAVDNAMAGYTDFMISQWLTEYVLVPLKLVVLGRKGIPRTGIFWKSVLAKTRQPAEMI